MCQTIGVGRWRDVTVRRVRLPIMASDPEPVAVPLNELYDEWTRQIARRVLRPGLIGIDVGAHAGDMLGPMVEAAPDDRHIAIEPIPSLAAELRKNFPTVSVHELALAAAAGADVSFHHVTSNPGYSGLRERRYDRENETVELTTVRTARLDDLVPEDAHVAMIKIDVEGGELGVLQGATKTLEARPVVVFEHGLGAADHYGTTPDDIWSVFADASMRVSLLQAYLEGGPTLTAAGFGEQFHSGQNYYFVAHV